MWRLIHCCLLLILAVSVTGCDPFASPDSMMDEYLSRLARVLNVEKQQTALEPVRLIPSVRDRRAEIPKIDITVLEFLSLYGCELQVVVAERNSILGRVMTPLNRLRYNLRFIATAQACLANTDKPALKYSLQRAIEQKQQLLSSVAWNAVWAGEPMAALLSVSKGYYLADSHHVTTLGRLVAGLEKTRAIVTQLQTEALDADLTEMGDIQQQWTFGHHAGQLLNSITMLTTRLDDATALIEQRLLVKPLCYMSKPNPQAERVKGVFFNVYIGRIQPYLSEVSRAGKLVFGELDKIALAQASIMPAGFKTYHLDVISMTNKKGVWRQFDKAVNSHTKSWQTLLEQCGMQPRSN